MRPRRGSVRGVHLARRLLRPGRGAHDFAVRATDAAGNVNGTPAVRSWTVAPPPDTTAPETSIDDGPQGTTSDTSASLTFSSDDTGASFECALDGAAYAACTSPAVYSGLALGAHDFAVRATDAAGNVDGTPAVRSWTVAPPPDTTAPETSIDSGPDATTSDTSATLTFSSEAGASFECALDGAAYAACTSPAAYSGLAEGAHTFDVRATDAAGNTDATPASRTWTIDINHDPSFDADLGDQSSAEGDTISLAASASDADGDALTYGASGLPAGLAIDATTGLISGTITFDAAGSHAVTVHVRDGLLVIDASDSFGWSVADTDVSAPETSIDSGPDATTSDTSATLTFSSEAGASFECALDAAPFAACTSPAAYSGLAEGAHDFAVRATDAAGNVDGTPAVRSWTVAPPPDTTAPETSIDSGPDATTSDTSATLTFSSEAGASFECALDAAPFAACTSPAAYSGLAEGAHETSRSAPPTPPVTSTARPRSAAGPWRHRPTPPRPRRASMTARRARHLTPARR